MNTNKNELEILIDTTSYNDLFLSDDTLLNEIWNRGESKDELKQLIKSDKTKAYTKLKAAEILYHYKVEMPKSFHKNLAIAYTYSLSHTSYEKNENTSLSGNLWGLLYNHDDAGILGSRILTFGELSIPYLERLLEDNDQSFLYEGSEQATLGSSYQYRVKDFAAFYISKIKDIPITFYQDFEKRDAEIERLKEILENE